MSAVWIEQEPTSLSSDRRIERKNQKLEKHLCRLVGQAIGDYRMIEAGNKVMVCLGGNG